TSSYGPRAGSGVASNPRPNYSRFHRWPVWGSHPYDSHVSNTHRAYIKSHPRFADTARTQKIALSLNALFYGASALLRPRFPVRRRCTAFADFFWFRGCITLAILPILFIVKRSRKKAIVIA